MSKVFYRSPVKTYPIISHGRGVFLWDTEGREYLDGSSGALVVNIGHGRTEVAEAMAEQASRVAFAHTARFTSEAQERLGEIIARRLEPERYFTYLVSGGGEATETAIKLARQYHLERGKTSKFKVMARWASYHGNTLGALGASGHLARRRPYAPLLADQAFVHFEGAIPHQADSSCLCLEHLEARIQQENPDTVSALILEVVGGSALSGFVPHPGYLKGVEQLCRRYDILFIVDEVMTGMGRTGAWWAHRAEGVRPDMMTLAKGLASGYSPLGAVVAHETVWDAIRQGSGSFAHGFTFSGNPVSAAAGVKVMEIMESEDLLRRGQEQGRVLAQELERLKEQSPLIEGVRGRGLMQGLVLKSVPGRAGAVAQQLGDDAFQHGLIIYPGSGSTHTTEGDHVLVAPPLTVSRDEMTELCERLAASLSRVQERLSM